MQFYYKAKKGIDTIEGEIDAQNSSQAIAKLEAMGCLPVKVEELDKPLAGKITKIKKIPNRELNNFTRKLSSMIKSKVRLLRALDILFDNTKHPDFKILIGYLRNEVTQGNQLSDALSKYPQYFSRLYINMVSIGEKSGLLEQNLLYLVDHSDREDEIKSKVFSAMAYPALMLVVGILTIFVMITFVMPKLFDLFNKIGQDLPMITQVLMTISIFAKNHWYWFALGCAVLGFMMKKLKVIERNRLVIDGMVLRVPIVGDIIHHRETARFARILNLLLESGFPIRDSIGIAVPSLTNRAMEKQLDSVTRDIAMGQTITQSLAKVTFLPEYVLSLISIGEEGGNLKDTFQEIAASYERELDQKIKIFSSLIEPILILVIGLVVGFIVMAMLMPIMDIGIK